MSNWSNEEVMWLERYYNSNMRIKSIMSKLDRSYDSVTQKLLTLSCYSSNAKKEVKNLDVILLEVLKYSKIKKDLLFSKTRKREVLQYRQLCHYYGELITRSSLRVIGEYFGDKDHGTVLHSIKVINNLIDTDATFLIIHDEILKNIRQKIFDKSRNLDKELQVKNQIKSIKSLLDIHSKIELNYLIKNLKDE